MKEGQSEIKKNIFDFLCYEITLIFTTKLLSISGVYFEVQALLAKLSEA